MNKVTYEKIETEKQRVYRLIKKHKRTCNWERLRYWRGYYWGLNFSQKKLKLRYVSQSEVDFICLVVDFVEKFDKLTHKETPVEKFKKLGNRLSNSLNRFCEKYY